MDNDITLHKQQSILCILSHRSRTIIHCFAVWQLLDWKMVRYLGNFFAIVDPIWFMKNWPRIMKIYWLLIQMTNIEKFGKKWIESPHLSFDLKSWKFIGLWLGWLHFGYQPEFKIFNQWTFLGAVDQLVEPKRNTCLWDSSHTLDWTCQWQPF